MWPPAFVTVILLGVSFVVINILNSNEKVGLIECIVAPESNLVSGVIEAEVARNDTLNLCHLFLRQRAPIRVRDS